MKSDFIIALTQLAAERNLPREIVLSAIEAALASAYKRDSIAAGQDISVKLDPGSGDVSVFLAKTVVEEITDPQLEFTLADAKKIKPDAKLGEVVATKALPTSGGRIAAQTAKQVVIQRLREAERDLVFQEFTDKEGDVFTVTVQRVEPKQVVVELGRAEAILPQSEQAPYDRYRIGQRIKVLLQSVRQSTKGPELIVSRADKDLVKRLFEMEVPEIYNGAVEILSIAREAGSRSKVAVWAKQDGVDAVGSCVGLRGIRIQNIVNELHGEKIDVVQWTKDPGTFIASALSPSTILKVEVDVAIKSATAIVPERQLSLAIGKDGQNARLAARLTGYRVDIKSDLAVEERPSPDTDETNTLMQIGLSARTFNILAQAHINSLVTVSEMDDTSLLAVKGLGKKSLTEIREKIAEFAATTETEITQDDVASTTITQETVAVTIEESPKETVEEVDEDLTIVVAEQAVEVKSDTEVVENLATEDPSAEDPPDTSDTEVQTEPPAELEIAKEILSEQLTSEEQSKKTLVSASDASTAIEDLPDDIWSVRRGRIPSDSGEGAIRFAEDIEELKRGGSGPGKTSRKGNRSRRTSNSQTGRGRKTGAGRRQ